MIWTSDSSTVVLREGIADLSRRFKIQYIPLQSFREYLALTVDLKLPVLDPYRIDEREVHRITEKINVLRYFKDYIAHGFRHIFLEGADTYLEKVMNTLSKAMQSDIPFLVPQISENHLRLMNAVIGYLASSSIPKLSVNTLCDEWGLSKEKLYQLLAAMERAHIIRIIRRKNDTKMHSIGAKVFLYEPSIYNHYGQNIGTMRESYFVGSAIEAGHDVSASIREEDYDFLVDDLKIEVGGVSKERKKADFIACDDLDVPSGNRIPLWVLGMEY
jgi:predicted AAA+ superfamily ATPase